MCLVKGVTNVSKTVSPCQHVSSIVTLFTPKTIEFYTLCVGDRSVKFGGKNSFATTETATLNLSLYYCVSH